MSAQCARRVLAALLTLAAATPLARAWDAAGHRMITRVALDGLGTRSDTPPWLKDPVAIEMIADEAVTPDRWRGVRVSQLTHLNNPDHYVDIEELADFGLTLRTIPRLRHEYVRVLTLARANPDFKGKPVDPVRDPARVSEYPGFLPFSACELYGKIVSAFKTERLLEREADPAKAPRLEMARHDAMVHMGLLAHFIGDAAQPLHTTVHHHGWIGDNPSGFTTDRGFHAYIDGTIVAHHAIKDADLRAVCTFGREASPQDPFDDVLAHLERSHAQLVPLYELKKTGDLEKDPGKKLITERLADASETLCALYAAAWKASEISEREFSDFRKREADTK